MTYRITCTETIGGFSRTVTWEAPDRATVDDQLDQWMDQECDIEPPIEPRKSEAPATATATAPRRSEAGS